jgi:hypothetical protein
VTEFLNAPQKLEQLKEVEQRRQFQFLMYENTKKQLFQLTLFGCTGIAAGFYTAHALIWELSAGLAAIGLVGYVVCSYKLKKWMKYMHEKRRD